jgi:hypothetical protein
MVFLLLLPKSFGSKTIKVYIIKKKWFFWFGFERKLTGSGSGEGDIVESRAEAPGDRLLRRPAGPGRRDGQE